ncbi:FAD-binding oxidoreductase [Methylibium sp.]|uniref:FAD-binding oxidoreductase n=1 Tax=Methylibium sp. TaxID=2067992 RepID=UPI003D0EA67D
MHKIHIENIDGRAIAYDCANGDTLLRSGLRAGVGFPYECNVGGCGNCRFQLVEGEIATAWGEAPGLVPRDRRKGLKLGCQSYPLSDCRIRLRLGPPSASLMRPTVHLARLAAQRELSPGMREFTFRTDGPADFLPGQYALLQLPGVDSVRAYSMSNLPNLSGCWQFIVRRVPGGEGTAVLFDSLKIGHSIEIDAPYGLAHYREQSSRDIICVAGGSGLAPMLSVARAASARTDGRLWFYFGGRTPQDMCAEACLASIPGFRSRIRHVDAVSRPPVGASGWPGAVGFIHEVVDHQQGPELSAFEIYMAGPPPMLRAMLETAVLKHRVPVEQIHYDRFF